MLAAALVTVSGSCGVITCAVATTLEFATSPILLLVGRAGRERLTSRIRRCICVRPTPPISCTSHFSRKSINPENDGRENKEIQRRTNYWFSAAGRGGHANQGNRAQTRFQRCVVLKVARQVLRDGSGLRRSGLMTVDFHPKLTSRGSSVFSNPG